MINETVTEGLVRRGYQAVAAVDLLVDGFLYDEERGYFHTVDGRFAQIWKVEGPDISMLSDGNLIWYCDALAQALNKYPDGSCGQFIRHTHRDIRPILDLYLREQNPHNSDFMREVAKSIVERQTSASKSPNGFFADLSPAALDLMHDDAVVEAQQLEGGAEGEDATEEKDVRSNVLRSISRDLTEGRFPFTCDMYLTFMWEPEKTLANLIGSKVKAGLCAIGVLDPLHEAQKNYEDHASEFQRYCYEIGQSLAANNFHPQEVNGQGWLNIIYHIANPYRSFRIDPPAYSGDMSLLEVLNDDSAFPENQRLNRTGIFSQVQPRNDGWTIHDSGMDYHILPVSLLSKPGRSLPGMLQKQMAGIEGESLVTLNWSVTKQITAQSRLWFRRKMLRSRINLPGGDKEAMAAQLDAIDRIEGQITSTTPENMQRFFDVCLHVNLMGPDRSILRERATTLADKLWRAGFIESIRGDTVVRSSLPFNYRKDSQTLLRRAVPHLTRSLSHMCPIFREYKGVADPAILMNNRQGEPIFLDLWGENVITAHSLICGTTGTGKSFSFNNILMALQVKYRPKIWIIDKGDSYESLCQVNDGNYIRLATSEFLHPITNEVVKPICVNPWNLRRDETGKQVEPTTSDLFSIAKILVMMIQSTESGSTSSIKPTTTQLLYEALEIFFKDWLEKNPYKEATFDDFAPVLRETNYTEQSGQTLYEALKLYISGPFSAVFNGPLDIDWDNDFTVLEIQRMAKEPALPVVTLALLYKIDEYVKYKLPRQRKKIIAVDEAWATLSDPTSAEMLSGFYRELRKYGAGVLLISQRVADFVAVANADGGGDGAGKDGILENTSHYFLLACSASDYKVAKEHLEFTDEEIALWRSLSSLPPIYSEIFYRMRTKSNQYYSGVFRLFACSIALWIGTSHQDDYALREKRTEEIRVRDNLEVNEARRRAIVELAKQYPYGSRYHVA